MRFLSVCAAVMAASLAVEGIVSQDMGGDGHGAANLRADGVEWSYEEDTSTLILNGTGVSVHISGGSNCPWSEVKDQVNTIILDGDHLVVDQKAFQGFSVKSVEVLSSSVALSTNAFEQCGALLSVYIMTNSTTIYKNAFFRSSLETLVISSPSVLINDEAFYGLGNLRSVTIRSSSLSIGARAFQQCISLQLINLSSDSTVIHSNAFHDCSNVKSLNVSSQTSLSVEREAFGNCQMLDSVIISSNDTTMEDNVFACCSKISSVSFTGVITRAPSNVFPQTLNSLKFVCVPRDYPSDTVLGIPTFYKSETYNQLIKEHRENGCYEVACDGNDAFFQVRPNVSEGLNQHHDCLEFFCVNETGEIKNRTKENPLAGEQNSCYEAVCDENGNAYVRMRPEVEESLNQHNDCLEFFCVNETGEIRNRTKENPLAGEQNSCYEAVCDENGNAYVRMRPEVKEFLEQHDNDCLEFSCDNETGVTNTTRKTTNSCFKYECGVDDPVYLCNESSYCVNNKCIDKSRLHLVEFDVENLTQDEYNRTETERLLKSLIDSNITVVTESEDDNIVRIVVIVPDEDTANTLKEKVYEMVDSCGSKKPQRRQKNRAGLLHSWLF